MLSWPLFVLCLLFLETQGRSTENILEKTLEDVEQLRALVLELKDIVSNQDQRISDLLLSQTIDRARIKTLEDENKTLISERSCNPCVTSDDGIRKNRTRDAPRKFPSTDVIMYKGTKDKFSNCSHDFGQSTMILHCTYYFIRIL